LRKGGLDRQRALWRIANIALTESPTSSFIVPHTEIQIGFRKQNVDAANKVPGI
jgi:hypothetical protein